MPIRWHFNRLAKSKDPSVDQALAAALPTVEASAVAPIARLLLQRGDAAATAVLIERFDTLPAELQHELTARIGDLYGACREAARRRGTAGPRKVIELVRQTRASKLVYLVAEQLRTGPVELRRSAAECLLELTEHFVSTAFQDSSSEVRVEESDQLNDVASSKLETRNSELSASLREMQAAVEEALLLYRHHHQPAVLLAFAMLLPGPCGKAMSALRDPRQPAVEGLRQLILDAHEPAINRHMLRWLTVPTLNAGAAAALPRLCRAGKLHLFLEEGSLLLQGSTRQAVAKLTDTPALLPSETDLKTMPAAAAIWLPHWLATLPMDESIRIAQLARLTRLPHLHARLATLRQLIRMTANPKAPADDLCHAIAEFCKDDHETLARLSLRHLLTARWDGLHRLLLELHQQSPHESVREMAARELAPIGFDALWNHWPRLPHAKRFTLAKALIKLDGRFHELLDQRLRHEEITNKLRALDIIATLNQGVLFEESLIPLARGPHDKLAASAVRALASGESPQASDALDAALAHRDARVRANAIEALDYRRVNQMLTRIRTIAQSDDNRPRANAIAKLLRHGDEQGPQQLRDMLCDLTSKHRISALWAVEDTGRTDTVGQIAEMAISDRDPAVRQRAARTLKNLLARMESPTAVVA